MTAEREKKRLETIQWVVDMYNAKQTVKSICFAAGITSGTLYRYIKGAENLKRRIPSRFNDTDIKDPIRAEKARAMWAKRATEFDHGIKRVKGIAKPLNALEVLSRLNLVLGKDIQGEFLSRGDKKIYLTTQEHHMLLRAPVQLLKMIAGRINAVLTDCKD